MLGAAVVLAAGCSAPGPVAVPQARLAKTYHSMPAAPLPLQRESVATTLAEYRHEFARLLHAANPGLVYDGPPPNPVRGVIVMRAEIDALGEMRRLELFRGPGHAPWLEQLVAQTVRQAEPFPRPSAKLLNGGGSVVFIETWLFDYEGRFRLRTLSQAQAEPPDEPQEEEFR
ncbi:MAG TPA: hypothetical protein VFS80_16875 [Burkholderiales bacterium]|nr:hypothetical protein [Burkholderiales bacterium]